MRQMLIEHFTTEIGSTWCQQTVGSGAVKVLKGMLQLATATTTATAYSNAQLDDYQNLHRRDFRWQPPLTLTVRARFSHSAGQLRGTAGFGFWNDPFMMTDARHPTLPRAIWFFYSSPPSNMSLALDVPGHGWKAATIDAWRLPFFLLAPTAPIAMPLMRIRRLYRALWPLAQRAIGVSEKLIDVEMTEWHTYKIEWGVKTARFTVDETLMLACTTPPRGPLGLVIWLDNQAMVVTPWGQFRHVLVASSTPQWMEVAEVQVISEQ